MEQSGRLHRDRVGGYGTIIDLHENSKFEPAQRIWDMDYPFSVDLVALKADLGYR